MTCERLCQNCWHVETEHRGFTSRCKTFGCGCVGFLPPYLPQDHDDEVRPADDATISAARLRWVDVMQDVVDDMEGREASCRRGACESTDAVLGGRWLAEADTYAHAAEMLRTAIRRAKEGT